MTTLNATLGDAAVELTVELMDRAGTVDLTDAITVAWTATGHTSARTISGTAEIVTPAEGTVTMTLTAAHLDPAQGAQVEDLELHWVVTWQPAKVHTFPTPGADRLVIDSR